MAAPVNFYADFKGLASLKNDAGQKDPKALREAARQFESLFTQMMLKSMREANKTFQSDSPLGGGDQTDFYRDMFDNQMAVQMSKGKGLGLGDMLVRQLRGVSAPEVTDVSKKLTMPGEPVLKHAPPSNAPIELQQKTSPAALKFSPPTNAPITAQSNVGATSISVEPTVSSATATKTETGEITVWCGDGATDVDPVTDPSDLSRLAMEIARARATEAKGVTSSAPREMEEGAPSISNAAPASEAPETIPIGRKEFVAQLWPHAKAAAEELGVDPHMLIAQAGLETGWGKSIPCGPDGTCSFNLFGIKAGSRWQGQAVGVNTLEFEDGVAVQRRASFRAYESPADSFRDYAALIKNSPRYAAAVGTGSDAAAFANALQRGGYATDPNYASKLTAVAERLRVSLGRGET